MAKQREHKHWNKKTMSAGELSSNAHPHFNPCFSLVRSPPDELIFDEVQSET